jgi:hypothetical protein
MSKDSKTVLVDLLKAVGTLAGALLFVTAAAWIFTSVQKKQGVVTQIVDTTNTASTTPTDYVAKDGMHVVVIINGFKNSVSGNIPSDKISKTLKVTGSFADGYLYVAADVNNKALQINDPTNYDAVFASLIELTKDGSDKEYGGHLIQSKSLSTPIHSDYTELLYKLSEVVYKKQFTDSDAELSTGNWLEVINDKSSREKIISFSSTVKGIGTIEKLVIYYKCADGSSCSITTE